MLQVSDILITFALVKQITIKIKQERDFIMSNEFDATKGISVFKANVLGFLFKNYEYAYDVIRNLVCDILPCYDISRLLYEHPFYVHDSLFGELGVVNIKSIKNNVVEFSCMFNEGEDSYSSMVKGFIYMNVR